MKRALLSITLAVLASQGWTRDAPTPKPPISSKAELDAYLRDTPSGISPLDALSPGGRKRFLNELRWGRSGLGGFSADDVDDELTHAQARRLLDLFGVANDAPDAGLSDAEQHRRVVERQEDARKRGCDPSRCPESAIEQKYDRLILDQPPENLTGTERFARAAALYQSLFADVQTPAKIRTVSDRDLRFLHRAADNAVFAGPSATLTAQLRDDLDEMQRRGMAEPESYRGLYNALVASRQFEAARQLAKAQPKMEVVAVPVMRQGTSHPDGWPTAITVDTSGKQMRRDAFKLDTPLRIVVVASCHFSKDAARAIVADPKLHDLFAKNAIWLANQGEPFDSVEDWNREFPDQPIHIAWKNSEWSVLDSWAMPTYYVFRNGNLVKRFSGWNGLPALKASLHEAGAL